MRYLLITIAFALAPLVGSSAIAATTAPTTYTLPQNVHWISDTGHGVPPGAFHADLRGKSTDKCGQLIRRKFTNGFVYPWHINGVYAIYTVIQGTLVIGFDKNHRAAGEKVLPMGSVMQGLTNEPHYGRAIGDTIFDVYVPCKSRSRRPNRAARARTSLIVR